MKKMQLIYNSTTGKMEKYDPTYDITIHCRTSEEKERVEKILASVRWIPVEERLPKEGVNPVTQDFYEYQCTYHDGGDVYDVRSYKFGRGHFWNGPGIVDQYITAWRENPAAYRRI